MMDELHGDQSLEDRLIGFLLLEWLKATSALFRDSTGACIIEETIQIFCSTVHSISAGSGNAIR